MFKINERPEKQPASAYLLTSLYGMNSSFFISFLRSRGLNSWVNVVRFHYEDPYSIISSASFSFLELRFFLLSCGRQLEPRNLALGITHEPCEDSFKLWSETCEVRLYLFYRGNLFEPIYGSPFLCILGIIKYFEIHNSIITWGFGVLGFWGFGG